MLGDSIKNELLGALKLLFKHVQDCEIDLGIHPGLTHFSMSISTEIVAVPLTSPAPEVSLDPIRVLAKRQIKSFERMLLDGAQLAENSPCCFAPAICREPILEPLLFSSSGIALDSLVSPQCIALPLPELRMRVLNVFPEGIKVPKTGALNRLIPSVSARKINLSKSMARLKILQGRRFFTLPVRKSPIPAHRFPLEIREQFRMALAEKVKTHPANVQLGIIFERMNMGLYASMQADAQGHLLCVPKIEVKVNQPAYLKRESHRHQVGNSRQESGKNVEYTTTMTYLVTGLRLDTREDIRALVPLERPSSDQD